MCSNGFSVIVFTAPESIDGEAAKLVKILEAGVDFIHVRKPGYDEVRMRRLLCSFPDNLRPRLTLHDHYHIASEYEVGGIHLNSRHPELIAGLRNGDHSFIPKGVKRISLSAHVLEEAVQASGFGTTYCTLSPIFDSISKKGYESRFDLDTVARAIEGKNVMALGGIKPDHLALLKEKGFSGAALLGYIWGNEFDYAVGTLADAIDKLKGER